MSELYSGDYDLDLECVGMDEELFSLEEEIKLRERAWEGEASFSDDEIRALIEKSHQGDCLARGEVLGKCAAILISKVNKLAKPGSYLFDELMQEGVTVVLESVDKFDLKKRTAKFSTYLIKALDRRLRPLVISERLNVNVGAVKAVGVDLKNLNEIDPEKSFLGSSAEEIAELTGRMAKTVRRGQKMLKAGAAASLNDYADSQDEGSFLSELIGDEKVKCSLGKVISFDAKEVLKELLDSVAPRDRFTLKQYYRFVDIGVIEIDELLEFAPFGRQRVRSAMLNFVESLLGFLEAPSVNLTELTIVNVKRSLYESLPDGVFVVEDFFAALFANKFCEETELLFRIVIDELPVEDATIVSSVFPLPTPNGHTMRSLATFLGVTRSVTEAAVNNRSLPLFLKKLKNRGYSSFADLLESGSEPSAWDYCE